MNVGKIFEDDFRKSMPDYVILYRLPDSAQAFFSNNNLRFSNKSPFDYILFDSLSRTLYAIELKTVKNKSISFERTKNDKGSIHYHQIKNLETWDSYNGTVCGLIIEFRELEITVFIPIQEFLKLQETIPKKSFNYKDLDTYNVNYIVINQRILKTHYRYDIETFLEKTRLH